MSSDNLIFVENINRIFIIIKRKSLQRDVRIVVSAAIKAFYSFNVEASPKKIGGEANFIPTRHMALNFILTFNVEIFITSGNGLRGL